jgi:hypothetical protein
MLPGIIPLWLMFWLGFIVWWSLMYNLFREGNNAAGLLIGYLLPSVYTLVAYAASKSDRRWAHVSHFLSFLVISIIYSLILFGSGRGIPSADAGPFLGTAFIAAVMSIMQYPLAGLKDYFRYRTPLFIAGVIFMPLFIYFASMLPAIYERYLTPLLAQGMDPHEAAHEARHLQALEAFGLFPAGMIGFWASAAWLAAKGAQGDYVPGLEIRPFMPFRPDFILPGGVLFVKGVIMMGVGLLVSIHFPPKMPIWNWWGFVLAFWGIITLIPLRGMYKMVKGRRRRMLGDRGAFGFRAEFYKALILFVGLLILLYGFVNAFLGHVPFTRILFTPQFNAFAQNPPTAWFGTAMLALSFIVLVVIRSLYKIRLPEGAETWGQLFVKQLLLWAGVVLLFLAYIHILWLPAITPAEGNYTGFLAFFPKDNPIGFSVGLALFTAGSLLILILRPIALRNELRATIRIFVGMIADAPEEVRYRVMKKRVEAMLGLPDDQRVKQLSAMVDGINRLPEERRNRVMGTQVRILSELTPEERERMMRTMDQVLFFKAA